MNVIKNYINKVRPHMVEGKRQKLLIKTLKASNGKCAHCGVEVYKCNDTIKGFRAPDNQATIDHIYHSYDIRRHTKEGETKVVLCCKKCNNTMGTKYAYYMSDEYYSLLYPPQDIFTLLNLKTCVSQ